MELTPEQKRRYNRHLILSGFGPEAQKRLLAAKVLIVGAGGLGSPVALYLAAAGVGTIGIVDGDTVSITNLQRQVIHFSTDIGKPKVDSAEEKIKAIILKKEKIIDIDSFLGKKPIEYPSEHAFNGQRFSSNIKILKNGNILFVNELKYSTDDSYGSDFDESYIEIYNNDLTKLINQKQINSYDEIILLKNDTIYLPSKGVIYDISNNQFNIIGTIENNFYNLFSPKNGKNYYNGRYDYKNKNYFIEILDEKLKIIKTLDLNTFNEYLNYCNNILEISDKNMISAFFLAGKIIFYNTKENKKIKSIDIYDKINNDFRNHYSYDNVIEKNGQLYFCAYDEIIVINVDNLQNQFSIKLGKGQLFMLFIQKIIRFQRY